MPDVDAITNEAEKRLRGFVSVMLAAKHGRDWEASQVLWPEGLQPELKRRLAEERQRRPREAVSERLLDYSTLSELRALIDRNWESIASGLPSKSETNTLLNIWERLRNPQKHARDLLPYEERLCTGICGLFLQVIGEWERGYKHKVQSYSSNLRFSVYEGEGVDARARARELAASWLEKVGSGQFVKVEAKSEGELLLRTPKGHVRVSMTSSYRGFIGGKFFQSTEVKLETQSAEALRGVLSSGGHPFWVLSWNLADDIDVGGIAGHADEIAGMEPTSSASVGIGSGPEQSVLTSVDYGIDSVENAEIRVALARAGPGAPAQVSLIYDGDPNKGFVSIGGDMLLDTTLSIVQGELAPVKVHNLVRELIGPASG